MIGRRKPTPAVVRVGQRPEPLQASGLYFDGRSAEALEVAITISEPDASLVITHLGREITRWPLDDIRRLPDQSDTLPITLRHKDKDLERLLTDEPLVLGRCTRAQTPVPVAHRGRLLAWGVSAVASVALIIGVLVPVMADQLARFIPPEGERALGEATLGQIRDALGDRGIAPVPVCTAPAGLAALRKMHDRLAPALPEQVEMRISVLDHDLINAFALPGGQIVLFRGLIEAAREPDEVAAVLAHEMGHVVSRDPTRHALRSAGSIGVLGLLLGDFAGGAAVLFLTERLISANYSQAAEAAADEFAYRVLAQADLPPDAMARMFRRMIEAIGDVPDPGVLAHFLTHPDMSQRIAAAEAATPEGFPAKPVLSASEWRALRDICP